MSATRQKTQLITIDNRQTVLGPRDLFRTVWSVNYSVAYFFNRSPWVRDGHAPHGHVVSLPTGARPPVGAWNLILLDTTNQEDALGWHDDEQGTGIPYSEVFVKTAMDDGAEVSAVACHEAFEMLCDPNIGSPWVVPNPAEGGRQYIVEVADMVEGNDFDVGAPEGRKVGIKTCDFAFPAWWGLKQTGTQLLSFRNSIQQPFTLAPGGYISWIDPGADPANPAAWHQSFGEKRTAELPVWASRLPRIHGR